MVSIATAVLPVWRSPMISSRWPRPIGTSASIALRPVCIGSWTDLRGMMPGALTSTRRRSVGLDRALAVDRVAERVDHAAEQALADRHVDDGAGALDGRRLRVISASEPKITTPTLSASRLSAMPLMPLANSTISPAWTLSRP